MWPISGVINGLGVILLFFLPQFAVSIPKQRTNGIGIIVRLTASITSRVKRSSLSRASSEETSLWRMLFPLWLGEAPESAITAFAQLLLVQATPLIVDRSIEIVANRPRSLAIAHRARPARPARHRPADGLSVPAELCRNHHGQRLPPLIPRKP